MRRLYNLGRFKEAITLCTRLLKEAKGSYFLWNLMGASYVAIGNRQNGLTCFLQAVALNPNYADAHNNCGTILKAMGR